MGILGGPSRGGSRISEGGVLTWTFIYVKIVDTTSVRSTLSMRSMLCLGGGGGVWGHAPTGKFCKFGLLRLSLVVILSEKLCHFVYVIPLFPYSLSI